MFASGFTTTSSVSRFDSKTQTIPENSSPPCVQSVPSPPNESLSFLSLSVNTPRFVSSICITNHIMDAAALHSTEEDIFAELTPLSPVSTPHGDLFMNSATAMSLEGPAAPKMTPKVPPMLGCPHYNLVHQTYTSPICSHTQPCSCSVSTTKRRSESAEQVGPALNEGINQTKRRRNHDFCLWSHHWC